MNTQSNVVNAEHAFMDKAERDMIIAVQQGDMDAYKRLYDQYIGQVYALCSRLTGDRGLAEDAAQEVFIQLWRKVGNFKGESKFSTWLHSVTSNIAISYMRKQKGWFQRMFDIEATSAVNETDSGSAGDIDLDIYIARLPERARIVFVLHAVEGYRHEDIANMTGMAVGSSKAQFHRAKQLIQEWMGDE